MSEFVHIPVLLAEAIQYLKIKPDGIYLDCTLGGAGHASEILKRLTTGHLYAIDQDEEAIKFAKEKLAKISSSFTIIHTNFANLSKELDALNIKRVDGIIYDLGVSSYQFDTLGRGFSYNYDAFLDMRMDQSEPRCAHDIVNNYSEDELVRIFFAFGEEKFSRSIAKNIVKARQMNPIDTTFQLVDIIKKSLPQAILRQSSHPAKKVFQAIRIEVNKELEALKKSLEDAFNYLAIGGRIVVISFHSLEDRICKQVFKEKTSHNLPKGLPFIPKHYKINYRLVNKNIITPSQEELQRNRRSHSAKLRSIERIA